MAEVSEVSEQLELTLTKNNSADVLVRKSFFRQQFSNLLLLRSVLCEDNHLVPPHRELVHQHRQNPNL